MAGRTDAFAVYRRVGTALAVLAFLLALSEMWSNAFQPTDRDFVAFWAAAKLALAGTPAAAWDHGALHAVQAEAVRFTRPAAQMPFAYPPVFLALVLPFGWLPFPAALASWAAATLVPFLFAVRRLFPRSGLLALAFPPVLVNAALGQNGFVTAALFIAALAFHSARPFAAGLLLGCLVIKPQLALMLPVAMLAGRQWRTIAGAACSSAALMLVGLLAFGSEASRAWLQQLPLQAEIARDGLVGWPRLVSVYAAARQAGLGEQPALLIHVAVALVAAAAVWSAWRGGAQPLHKAAILCAATMLASPYLFLYDSLLLVVPLLWLAERGAPPALVGALWLLPAVTIAQLLGLGGAVNLGPLLPVALLAICSLPYRARMNSRARSYS